MFLYINHQYYSNTKHTINMPDTMPALNGAIFINYRKDDSSWNALALYNELLKYFAREQLFKDFNTILPGDDFVVSIQNALRKCDVLLVIIGKNWLNMTDTKGQRRLDDPDDFVRIEIATALERKIQVIPVLFDGTTMPSPTDLPADLNLLYRRQFVEIDTKRFEDDVRKLADAIKKVLGESGFRPQYDDSHNPQPGGTARTQRQNDTPISGIMPPPPKPDNNLVWGILSTLLCCLPLGIASIIYASKVDGLYAAGKYAEAANSAKQAKQWAIYAAIVGVVLIVVLYIIGTLNPNNSYSSY